MTQPQLVVRHRPFFGFGSGILIMFQDMRMTNATTHPHGVFTPTGLQVLKCSPGQEDKVLITVGFQVSCKRKREQQNADGIALPLAPRLPSTS